jgi:hypothetical protein
MTDKIIYVVNTPEHEEVYFATRDEAQTFNASKHRASKGSIQAVLVEHYEEKARAALRKLSPLDQFLVSGRIEQLEKKLLHFEDDRGSPLDTLNR